VIFISDLLWDSFCGLISSEIAYCLLCIFDDFALSQTNGTFGACIVSNYSLMFQFLSPYKIQAFQTMIRVYTQHLNTFLGTNRFSYMNR